MTKQNDYRILYIAQEGRCFYCNSELSPRSWGKRNKSGWTRDHFRPKRYGAALLGNVVLCCFGCNLEKSDRMPTQEEGRRFNELSETYDGMKERGWRTIVTPPPHESTEKLLANVDNGKEGRPVDSNVKSGHWLNTFAQTCAGLLSLRLIYRLARAVGQLLPRITSGRFGDAA